MLEKTRKYRYVLVTEHYAAPFVKMRLNLDKPHGPETRIYDSAVYLDLSPFNLSPNKISLVLDIDAEEHLMHKGERLKTFLIEKWYAWTPRKQRLTTCG